MTDKKDHSTNETKGESSNNRLVGDQSNQFVEPKFYGHVTFNQTGNPSPTKILFDDSYTPPTPPPLHELPGIAPKPPGSYLPFIEDRNFTGRKGDLDFLAENLFYSQKPNPIVVIHGIGGLGKSHLAIRYCQLYGQFYRGVHWINAKEDFNLGVAICGDEMNIQPWPTETPDQVRLTKAIWGRSRPRLIILDDITDPSHLLNLVKDLPAAHILATSRCENWPTSLPVEERDLDQMTLEEARSFLRRVSPRLRKTSDKDLDDLTTTLGGLPLALYLAGCYLRDRGSLPVADYLQQISEAETLLEEREYKDWTDLNPSDHSNSLLATFEVSWKMLEEKPDAEIAKLLFKICGYCSPSIPIPHEFIETIEFDTDDKKQMALAIRLLKSVGLVESVDQDLLIHPLLAEFARLKDPELSGLSIASGAYGALSHQLFESRDPRAYAKHLSHLRKIAVFTEENFLKDSGNLWNYLGLMNRELANFIDAKANFEKALALDIQFYGKEHSIVATRFSNLGSILRDLGDLPAAKANFEKALTLNIRFFGEEHPTIATQLCNLGNVQQEMGDFLTAKANLEKALALDIHFFGEEHRDVAIDLGNLGSVLHEMGDLPAAQADYERALAIDILLYGEKHPNVATDLNNLGSILRDLGDLPTAKVNFEKALTIDIQFYGEEHPTVATRLSNLGGVLQDLGDLPAAKTNFEKALAIDIQFYGEEHPTVARRLSNLGGVLRDLRDLPAAKANYEKALAIDIQCYGEEHPSVATLLGNLGGVLQDLGDLPAAKANSEKALALAIQFYGEEHPTIAMRLNNLGVIQQDLSDLPAAKANFKKALEIFEEKLPPNHPYIRTAKENLQIVNQQIQAQKEANK
jgi:tetratricopeptide (TPR) repeat protein